MTSIPIDQLVSRLNRKRNAFEKALGELRDLLNQDDASKLETEIKLERLRYQREGLLETYEPVIRAYEKVVTDDGERKVKELEEACDEHQGMFIEAQARFKDKFASPESVAESHDSGALTAAILAATTTAQAAQAAAASTTAPSVPKPCTRLPEIPPIIFRGSLPKVQAALRRQYR